MGDSRPPFEVGERVVSRGMGRRKNVLEGSVVLVKRMQHPDSAGSRQVVKVEWDGRDGGVTSTQLHSGATIERIRRERR